MKYYLEFEEPIRLLDEEIHLKESIIEKSSKLTKEIALLHEDRLKLINKIHTNLTRWQRVQLARHPERPYALDYINLIFSDFMEIHGDRLFADDPAVVAGFAKIGDKKVAIIAQQKGRNTKENLYRNFGMMKPEGYRKCIRLMKLADRFKIPVISFIDTPGAYPGIGAEQRGQAMAIANSIECCMSLKVPNISIIIGEGGSGGAIALASSNKVIMLEHSIYSVISPEGCASILWRDPTKSLEAAEAMKLTAEELLKLKIIDEIIPEPLGGAHRDSDQIASEIKKSILKNLEEFENLSGIQILEQRKNRFLKIGRDQGFKKSSNIEPSIGLSYIQPGYNKFIRTFKNNKKLSLIVLGVLGLVAFLYLIV